MKRTIFKKIFGGYLSIILFFSAAIIFLSLNLLKTYQINQLNNNLTNLAKSLRYSIQPSYEKKEYTKLEDIIKNIGNDINTRITVIDLAGKVWADSDKDVKVMVRDMKHKILFSHYCKDTFLILNKFMS